MASRYGPPYFSELDTLEDDQGNCIASIFTADDTTTIDLLSQTPGEDTRSEMVWVRLSSGELLLGCFPRGEWYEDCELQVEADYKKAVAATLGFSPATQRNNKVPGPSVQAQLDEILKEHGD